MIKPQFAVTKVCRKLTGRSSKWNNYFGEESVSRFVSEIREANLRQNFRTQVGQLNLGLSPKAEVSKGEQAMLVLSHPLFFVPFMLDPSIKSGDLMKWIG